MILPKIIIIGAAKCGTTALWYNLDKHPDIYMATRTDESIELHFWHSKFWNKGFDWYSSRFVADKICGEKSVDYWGNKPAMKAIKKHIPDVKLLLCVRNPVDRAYSNFQMHRNAGRISKFDYKPYLGVGKYIGKIQNKILPFFDKDQLHICVAEYMKKDPTSEMSKVFEFLEVEDLNLPKKVIDGMLRRYRTRQEDIKLNQREKFYRVWDRWSAKDSLTGSVRDDLLKIYKPHNEKLFDFLGYEIKEWYK